MTPEGRVKAKVKRALDKLPAHYRFMPVQNGMGTPGLDFFCCIGGYFVAIETKAPGGKLTARQKDTKAKIEKAKGTVFVIENDDQIADMMRKITLGLF